MRYKRILMDVDDTLFDFPTGNWRAVEQLMEELSLSSPTIFEEYQAISPVFEQDIYEAISMKTCVEKRETYGAPGPKVMKQVIEENKKYL